MKTVTMKTAELLSECGMKVEYVKWWSANDKDVTAPKTLLPEAADWLRTQKGILLTVRSIGDSFHFTASKIADGEIIVTTGNEDYYRAMDRVIQCVCYYLTEGK